MHNKKHHIVRKTMIVLGSFILGIVGTVIAAATYDASIQTRVSSMMKSIKTNASTLAPSDASAYYTLVHLNIQSLLKVLTSVDEGLLAEISSIPELEDANVLTQIAGNTGVNSNNTGVTTTTSGSTSTGGKVTINVAGGTSMNCGDPTRNDYLSMSDENWQSNRTNVVDKAYCNSKGNDGVGYVWNFCNDVITNKKTVNSLVGGETFSCTKTSTTNSTNNATTNNTTTTTTNNTTNTTNTTNSTNNTNTTTSTTNPATTQSYLWSCVVAGPVAVNTSQYSCNSSNAGKVQKINGYDCTCTSKTITASTNPTTTLSGSNTGATPTPSANTTDISASLTSVNPSVPITINYSAHNKYTNCVFSYSIDNAGGGSNSFSVPTSGLSRNTQLTFVGSGFIMLECNSNNKAIIINGSNDFSKKIDITISDQYMCKAETIEGYVLTPIAFGRTKYFILSTDIRGGKINYETAWKCSNGKWEKGVTFTPKTVCNDDFFPEGTGCIPFTDKNRKNTYDAAQKAVYECNTYQGKIYFKYAYGSDPTTDELFFYPVSPDCTNKYGTVNPSKSSCSIFGDSQLRWSLYVGKGNSLNGNLPNSKNAQIANTYDCDNSRNLKAGVTRDECKASYTCTRIDTATATTGTAPSTSAPVAIPVPSITADKTTANAGDTVTFRWIANDPAPEYCNTIVNNSPQDPRLWGPSGSIPVANVVAGNYAIKIECKYTSGYVRTSPIIYLVVTAPTIAYNNLVNGGGITACNKQILDKFGTQKYTCSIGGGCGLNGQPKSSTNLSANPSQPGACILQSEWDSAVAPAPVSCAAGGPAPWMTNCSGSWNVTTNGTMATVVNTNPGYTGEYKATCNNGTWTFVSQSCTSSSSNFVSGQINGGGSCTINPDPAHAGCGPWPDKETTWRFTGAGQSGGCMSGYTMINGNSPLTSYQCKKN